MNNGFLYVAKEGISNPDDNGWPDDSDPTGGPPWPDGFQDTPNYGFFYNAAYYLSFTEDFSDKLDSLRTYFNNLYLDKMYLTNQSVSSFGLGMLMAQGPGTETFPPTLFFNKREYEYCLVDTNLLVVYSTVYLSTYSYYDSDDAKRYNDGPESWWRSRFFLSNGYIRMQNQRWDADTETWGTWFFDYLNDDNFTTAERPEQPRTESREGFPDGIPLQRKDFLTVEIANNYIKKNYKSDYNSSDLFYGAISRLYLRGVHEIFNSENEVIFDWTDVDDVLPNSKLARISRAGVYIKNPGDLSTLSIKIKTKEAGGSEVVVKSSNLFPGQWSEVVEGILLAEGEDATLTEDGVVTNLTLNTIKDFDDYTNEDKVYGTINPVTDKIVILNGSSGVTNDTEDIDSVQGGTLVVDALTGEGTCDFRVVRPMSEVVPTLSAGATAHEIEIPVALLSGDDPLFLWFMVDCDAFDNFAGGTQGYIYDFEIWADGSQVAFPARDDKTRIQVGVASRQAGRTIEFVNEQT